MEEENPFALKGKGRKGRAPAVQPKARTFTKEEQTERLTDYIEIPPEYWHLLRYSTHVRYYNRDGTYNSGGFILKNPFDTKPKGTQVEKRFMKLQNGFNAKTADYRQWIVAYEDVKSVYAKADGATMAVVQMLGDTVKGLNENIKKIAEYSKRLEARVADLEKSSKA